MHSCIYRGHVRHRRFHPLSREFRYPISFLYLDLDELPDIIARLPGLAQRRCSLASVCREDHWGDPQEDLSVSVRKLVRQAGGDDVRGPVRLLTLWRSLGLYFSPVNFYFCFDDAEQVQAIVAEVTNTPWRERHAYVLSGRNATASGRCQFAHSKQFHVSPFLDMDLEYRWRLTHPGSSLTIHLEACDPEHPLLDATLTLQRQELTRSSWLATVIRYPCVPARVLAGIHWEALRLWLNKAPFYPHPRQRPRPPSTMEAPPSSPPPPSAETPRVG